MSAYIHGRMHERRDPLRGAAVYRRRVTSNQPQSARGCCEHSDPLLIRSRDWGNTKKGRGRAPFRRRPGTQGTHSSRRCAHAYGEISGAGTSSKAPAGEFFFSSGQR